jgi:hypothetical protein
MQRLALFSFGLLIAACLIVGSAALVSAAPLVGGATGHSSPTVS